MPAMLKSTSYMSNAPWDEVALKVLAPVACAPWMTDAAENSLSVLTYSQLGMSPLAII
jgi:hypothetical protein